MPLKSEITYIYTNEKPSMDYLIKLMKLWMQDPVKHSHLKSLMQGDTTLSDYFIDKD